MKKYCSHHMKYVCGFYREGKVQVSEKTRTGWEQKFVKMNERIEVKWKSELWLFAFHARERMLFASLFRGVSLDSMQFQSSVMASY